jgi:ABC-type Fe3+-hydroxamate transport system substrate-binding protein
MSEKRERFKSLAEKRVERVLKQIRLIGNLANRNHYDYTPEDVSKIINAIEQEFKVTKARFKSSREKKSFKL